MAVRVEKRCGAMNYPYRILRQLDSASEEVVTSIYATQLEFLRRRVELRLQTGVPPHQADDFRILLEGCNAALEVLAEIPHILERWKRLPGPAEPTAR